MKARYINYDVPDFVKESPDFEALFQVEDEIVKNANGKWGIKRGVNFTDAQEEDESSDSTVDLEYDTFFEAYYDNEKRGRALWFSDDIAREIFVDQVEDEEDKADDDLMFLTRSVSDNFSRMYGRGHGDYRIGRLEFAYEQWKEQDAEITQDSFTQENVVDVYFWLAGHPNFWKRRQLPDGTYDWETELNLGEIIDVFPQRDRKTQEVYWTAEGGYHVLDDTEHVPYATTYYHDYALNATGDTYEEAMLDFAKNVWLQTHGLLKEREAARDAWLDSLMERGKDLEEGDVEE
jgi:hypothetical protein